jgi:hypothetical protein
MAARERSSRAKPQHRSQPANLALRLALQQEHAKRRSPVLDCRVDQFAEPVPQLIGPARRIIDDHKRRLVPSPIRNVMLLAKPVELFLFDDAGQPSLFRRLARQFERKPRLAAAARPNDYAQRNGLIAAQPVPKTSERILASEQGNNIRAIGAQQRRIGPVEPGQFGSRLKSRQAQMRDVRIDRDIDAAADRLNNDVLAAFNPSVWGRIGHWRDLCCN